MSTEIPDLAALLAAVEQASKGTDIDLTLGLAIADGLTTYTIEDPDGTFVVEVALLTDLLAGTDDDGDDPHLTNLDLVVRNLPSVLSQINERAEAQLDAEGSCPCSSTRPWRQGTRADSPSPPLGPRSPSEVPPSGQPS